MRDVAPDVRTYAHAIRIIEPSADPNIYFQKFPQLLGSLRSPIIMGIQSISLVNRLFHHMSTVGEDTRNLTTPQGEIKGCCSTPDQLYI